jgi:hypothetical protein
VGLEPFPFESPATLLAFYDEDIREGKVTQHAWQARMCLELSKPWKFPEQTFKCNLLAVNGSGKDLMVIAPFAIWHLLARCNSQTTITSSSANQLEGQTSRHIQRLAEKVNLYHNDEIIHITERELYCEKTGSFINLFVTDEPGRAEGWHQLTPGASFALICNEAKSVPDSTDEAFARCNGANIRINISSPGKPEGFFFDRYTCGDELIFGTQNSSPSEASKQTSPPQTPQTPQTSTPAFHPYVRLDKVEKEEKPNFPPVSSFLQDSSLEKFQRNLAWKNLKVTFEDCPHLGGDFYRATIEADYGPDSPLTRALLYAEFTSTDEQVVIHSHLITRCLKFPPTWIKESKNTGGLDLSGGGDETTLVVRNGNKIIGLEAMREHDTATQVFKVENWFKKWELGKGGSIVHVDAGGRWASIADLLRAKGYKLRYHFNNSESSKPLQAGNKGTEMWLDFSKLVEDCDVILIEDKILRKQLVSRYYEFKNQDNTTVPVLEPKRKAKTKAHPSPDRADACVLSFFGYRTPTSIKVREERKNKRETEEQKTVPTINRLVKQHVRQEHRFSVNGGPRFAPTDKKKWKVLERELDSILVELKEHFVTKE